MLNTLERVEPGPQSQGWEGWKLGTRAGRTDNSQGLGRRKRSLPEQLVCRGRRHEAGTGKEGVGIGDRRAKGC